MAEYIYSAKNNAFYPVDMKEDYIAAGSWPDDGIKVSQDCFLEFTSASHTDKYRIVGEDGYPAWEAVPAPSREQLIALAESEKARLIDFANASINVKQWPGKAVLGRLKGEELADYNLWLDYLDALQAVDTSKAPDIHWPELAA